MARRLIDNDNAVATRTLKVCCIGLPRTGTLDLALALSNLGYRPYHGCEIVKNGMRDMELLLEALTLKHTSSTKSEQYGQEELDRIWGKYDALVGLPGFAFVDEVLTYYPNVQFILTVREPHDWLRDMQRTVFPSLSVWPLVCPLESEHDHTRQLRPLMRLWARLFCGLEFAARATTAYSDHVKHCLKVIPRERLLILHYGGENDWEDLCEFLEKRVPESPYPSLCTVRDCTINSSLRVRILKRWTEWSSWLGFCVGCPIVFAAIGVWISESLGLDIAAKG